MIITILCCCVFCEFNKISIWSHSNLFQLQRRQIGLSRSLKEYIQILTEFSKINIIIKTGLISLSLLSLYYLRYFEYCTVFVARTTDRGPILVLIKKPNKILLEKKHQTVITHLTYITYICTICIHSIILHIL